MDLTRQIVDRAYALGFDLAGVAPATPLPCLDAYRAWLQQGYHGQMAYMARPDRVARRADPNRILPGARSIICVGLNYYPGPTPPGLADDPARGFISNHAWGADYHALLQARLEELVAYVRNVVGEKAAHRIYVDTGPILERAYAAEAGLGFVGKNTCLVNPRLGSWLFLGEILTDVDLPPTTGEPKPDCGNCRRCLEACPTGALVAPYVLDARRCIAYLTIELAGPIPRDLRSSIGNHVYGCDTCQSVCPWHRFTRPTQEQAFRPPEQGRVVPWLVQLIEMNEEQFQRQFAGTSILRTGRARLARNAAVALGNWRDEQAIPVLKQALERDEAPLVRGHAAWALGELGQAARQALRDALPGEVDPYVREEIQEAETGSSRP